MTKNKISVIIPIYNTEKYLCKCLDSIVAQTYTKWEAVLVNDGSTDNSGIICDEYAKKDTRFKVIHQQNSGVVNARNNAIAKASGEFLAFVDSDDFIEATMLEEMVYAAVNKNADVVWCDVMVILREGGKVCNIKIEQDPFKTLKKLITGEIPGWMCNKLIKKSFWDNCKIITDESAVILEDTFISIQMMNNTPNMTTVNKPLYNYVRTNENSATYDGNIIKAEKNISHIYNYLKQNKIYNICEKEFTDMALTFKIQLLKQDINKAYNFYPFAHRKFRNFRFPFEISLFYWIAFNSGFIGKKLFKLHFK